jgi:hypothetical protein
MSQRNETTQIIYGVLFLFGLHILVITVFSLLGYVLNMLGGAAISLLNPLWAVALFGIGISQLIYVVPMIIWLKQRQEWGLMKGVIIGAVLTALLNGGCWLLLINQIR